MDVPGIYERFPLIGRVVPENLNRRFEIMTPEIPITPEISYLNYRSCAKPDDTRISCCRIQRITRESSDQRLGASAKI